MTMAYVAVDPAQPGAACAVVVDDPNFPADTAKTVARFISQGRAVNRVPLDEARAMLAKWVRPPKAKQDTLF